MFSILRHYGVPAKMVQSIEAIYHNSRSAVLVNGNLSEEFNVAAGVLQGDTLAPFLFIIVVDYVMKNAENEHTNSKGEHGFATSLKQSARHQTPTMHDLDFVDDIVLLENTLERAQYQPTTTAKWPGIVRLQVHVKKTQAMTNQTRCSTRHRMGE
jgi:hypothetical protein